MLALRGRSGASFTLDRNPSAALDRESFSEPPRSAKNSRDRFSMPLARCTRLSITMEWARDERSFIAVAALRLHRSAAASSRLACATSGRQTRLGPRIAREDMRRAAAGICRPSMPVAGLWGTAWGLGRTTGAQPVSPAGAQ